MLPHQLAPKRRRDQRPRFRDPVQRHERPEARPPLLPEQDPVERREPGLGDARATVRADDGSTRTYRLPFLLAHGFTRAAGKAAERAKTLETTTDRAA